MVTSRTVLRAREPEDEVDFETEWKARMVLAVVSMTLAIAVFWLTFIVFPVDGTSTTVANFASLAVFSFGIPTTYYVLHLAYYSMYRDRYSDIALQLVSLGEEYVADMNTVHSILSSAELSLVKDDFWQNPEHQEQLKSKLGPKQFRKFEENTFRLRKYLDRLLEASMRIDQSWLRRCYEISQTFRSKLASLVVSSIAVS